MLTCIARSKRAGDETSGQPDDPDSKQAKSLTSQVDFSLSLSLFAHPPPLVILYTDQGYFRKFILSSKIWL